MKLRVSLILFVILFFAPLAVPGAPTHSYEWDRLADGLEYTIFSFEKDDGEKALIHAFQIDPKKFRIDVVNATNETEGSTAGEMARSSRALIVINGGFFTPEHRSIGLIVKSGRELNPIHKTSWWSIFAISENTPRIFTPRDFAHAKDVRMALQVGPRLAVDGAIPKLKEGLAPRSAVGITRDGKIIVAMTQGVGITMNELARRMNLTRSGGGLDCPNAMALDGGSSSQLYAKVKKFELSLPGIARITNGLAVFAK